MSLEKKLLIMVGLIVPIFFIAAESKSQIVPDSSLPTNSSVVREGNILNIEEGTIRGDNLFHSFQDFSVQTGNEAFFNNALNVSNIFSRVTGANISNIDGLIRANGSASLFLINPAGIIFGENGQLNIGGSFLGTTANAIEFIDGTKFNSIEPENPILTVNIPIGLDFGTNPKSISDNSGLITVNGSGHLLNGNGGNPTIRGEAQTNLSVLPSNNLALIGKEVRFSGGVLVSPSGNLDIASIRQGKVEITTPNNGRGKWELNYEDAEVFGNITFANRSLLDSSSIPNSSQLGSGSVTVQGSNISSQDGSVILNQNFGDTTSGAINIIASDSFQISGTDPIARIAGGIRTETFSRGNGADINISTPELANSNGGSIQTFSYSPFPNVTSGNININTSNLQIIGASPRSAFTVSNITTFTFNTSQAGNISISSDTINLEAGGTIVSSGILGNVGEISIDTTKYLKIQGFQPEVLISSSINSINSSSPISGKINITSPSIFIQNGGGISTSTFAGGSAGQLVINTNNLEITGKTNPQSRVALKVPSRITSSATFVNETLIQSLPERIDISNFSDLPLEGNSGAIGINSNSIKIEDGGQIAVVNQGTGNAGNIEINADKIHFENQGSISASTASGEGGNVVLNVENLELVNQSQISASAGGSGNGGNVTINSDSILGIENSDITANAIGGNGGDITINSDAILGLEERSQLTPFGDITATSEFGVDGTVTINSPDIDFENEVFNALIPERSIPKLKLLNRKCLNPRRKDGKLLSLGRGGVPENNRTFFDIEEIPDSQTPKEEEPQVRQEEDSMITADKVLTAANGDSYLLEEELLTWQEGDPILQANRVLTTADGKIFIVPEAQLKDAEPQVCTRNEQG